MSSRTRTRLLALLVAATLSSAATSARADDDETPPDARLEGFQNDKKGPLVLDKSGTTTTWFLAVILGGLCFGVMSKNAKRTHLD